MLGNWCALRERQAAGMNVPVRLWSAALAAALGLAAGTPAQDTQPSLLEEARRRNEIAAQKVEADVRAALTQAVTATPAEAARLLKDALARVEAETALSDARKATLT